MPIITALELTSQVRYIADGLTTEFPITFERISDNHVKAWLYDDEADEVTELARSVTDNVATITPPPAENTYVIIHRQTPKPALIDWSTTPGESRNARVLAERQSRYIALEALDWSQYPIRSIVATSPPPFTWRTVAAGDSLNKSDNNHGVDLTTVGTLHIPPAVGQEREFSTLVRLPVGTSTIMVNDGTIDGEASISITATASDRIIGIILRSAGVFNTAGRLQVSFGVEDILGLGSVGADLVMADSQAEAIEAMGLSNAVTHSVPTSGDATNSQLVKGGDSRLSPATASKTGTMSAADKSKLDGIAAGANNYTHPLGDGNQHVPATGTTSENKVLVAGNTAGSASWQTFAYAWLTGAPSSLPASDVYSWAKQPAKPSYTYGEISGTPSSLPASDVYVWAKAATKPTYTNTEVGAAAASHTHSADAVTSGTISNSRLSSALAYIGALTPTTGGTPFYTAAGGPASLYTTSSWFRGTFAPVADAAEARTLLGLAAIATSGSASNLIAGTIPDDRLPGRLIGGWIRSAISDANSATATGSYYIDSSNAGALNAPFTDASANIDTRALDPSGASYAVQFACAVAKTSGIKNQVRYKIAGTWGSWIDAPVSSVEQALLWATVGHTEHAGITQYPAALRGSVVQTTSHTTAVTLNAAQGSIKMAPGALGAGASVEFQLNNTYITESQMPVVVRRGALYTGVTASVLRFAPGYCIIRVTNTGATTETAAEPAMSFTILGVAAS